MGTRDYGEKTGFLFDVDGTLYAQNRLRVHMLIKLLLYYALHPRRAAEFYALYLFRRYREREEYRTCSIPELCAVAARRAGLSAERVEGTVRRWVFEEPLRILDRYAYSSVIAFARRMADNGKAILIYSDYPVAEKLRVLGMPARFVFVSGEAGMPGLKPCAEAMRHLVNTAAIPPSQLLYIGDRDEKDRRSAELAGIEYCDIREFRKWVDRIP